MMGVFWLEEFIGGWPEKKTMIKASSLSVAKRKAEKLANRTDSELLIVRDGIIVARKEPRHGAKFIAV